MELGIDTVIRIVMVFGKWVGNPSESGTIKTQWRIQDFPERGANSRGGAPTYYFAILLPETA